MDKQALTKALNGDLAGEHGDTALAAHLETVVEDETAHYEETEKILRGWG